MPAWHGRSPSCCPGRPLLPVILCTADLTGRVGLRNPVGIRRCHGIIGPRRRPCNPGDSAMARGRAAARGLTRPRFAPTGSPQHRVLPSALRVGRTSLLVPISRPPGRGFNPVLLRPTPVDGRVIHDSHRLRRAHDPRSDTVRHTDSTEWGCRVPCSASTGKP